MRTIKTSTSVLLLATIALGIWWLSLPSCSPNKGGKWKQNYKTIYYSDSVATIVGDSVVNVLKSKPDSRIISVVINDEYQRRHERSLLIIGIAALILLGCLAFVIYSFLKRRLVRQLNSELDEKTGKIEQMREEINSLDKKSNAISDTLDNILKQNIETIRKLASESNALNKKEESDFYPDMVEELQDKIDSIRLTIDRLHKRVPIQKGLEKTLNATKDGIMSRVRSIFGNTLSESDYQVLSGIFAGLSAQEISFITGLEPGTVRTRKSRIKVRFKDLPDSPEKTSFLSYF